MKQEEQTRYYWIGTFFLSVAMMLVTIIPVIVTKYLPIIYIEIRNYISTAAALFIITLILYLLSKNTFKKQIISLLLAFIYFYAFINLFGD